MLKQLILNVLLMVPIAGIVGQNLPVHMAKGPSGDSVNWKSSSFFSNEEKPITAEEKLADTIVWEKLRYIPPRGVGKDFSYFFETLHGTSQKVYFKGNKNLSTLVYDSLNNKYYNRQDKISSLEPGRVVMGWHPYWMKDSYQDYNYGLLSIISYYSYDVDASTGNCTDTSTMDDWSNTAMIDSARANGVKVMLTVTSYGREQNEDLLSNKMAWTTLAENLKTLLKSRNGYGIDLDFSEVPEKRGKDFTSFVKALKSNLGNDYILSVQIPPYNGGATMDFSALSPYVEYFILQGFEYNYLDCNGNPAPVAALSAVTPGCPSISKTLEACLKNGLDPTKTILALPAYGTKWSLASRGVGGKESFEGYLTYSEVLAQYGTAYQPIYDFVSGSTYFLIDAGSGSTGLIWYESGESIDAKSKWALANNLKGIGIWALGYDGTQPGIWNAVAVNFGTDPFQEISPMGYANGKLYSIMASVVRHKRAIGFGVLFLLGFFILGLLISLFDWRVREVFFQNYTYRTMFSAIAIALLVIAVVLINGISLAWMPLLIGLCGGAVIVLLVTKRYKYYRGKLP